MIHIYEVDDDRGPVYWEVFEEDMEFLGSVHGQKDMDYLLDKYRSEGVDFIIHELGGIDEYHVALPSV